MKLPSQFTSGDKLFSTSLDITNGFNNFFANVGKSLAKDIPPTNDCPIDNIKVCLTALGSFEPPTCNEVLEIIDKLKNSAAGQDEIKAKLLKEVASSIIKPLTHVLAVSLKTGVVPNDLKVAKVLPLFKEGDPCLFNNYH